MFEKLIIKLSGIDCSKINPLDYDILLRSPGQSLDEKLENIKDQLLEKVFKSFLLVFLGIITVAIFGLSYYFEIVFVLLFFNVSFYVFQKYKSYFKTKINHKSFNIFYNYSNDVITIVSIAHQHKKPIYIKS